MLCHRGNVRLAAVYSQRSVCLELACGKDVLFSGFWQFDVRFDGEPAVARSTWEEVCSHRDKQVDYRELEIALTAGLRVQRHVLLARKERLLLLADAILADRPGMIDYRSVLPLCAGMEYQPAEESREGFLAGRKRRALLVPLALPEWRCQVRSGDIIQTAAGVELRQAAEGCGLFAPLFFDLDRHRLGRPVTWRQLTVAEARSVQPPDVAVGYRVAIGKRQWLIYRSLAEKASRSLLGINTRDEMLVARFDRRGEVKTLLEVE